MDPNWRWSVGVVGIGNDGVLEQWSDGIMGLGTVLDKYSLNKMLQDIYSNKARSFLFDYSTRRLWGQA